MDQRVHEGAVSAVAEPGDAVGRELPPERWCGWSGLGGQPTPGQSGCLGGPPGLRAGAELPVEAQGQAGGYLRRTGPLRSHPAGMCGCLGADPLQRPQRCGCAGQGAAGCGVSGAARSGQLLCSQIGSGLCVKGRVGTEEQKWGPRGREGLGVSRGAGPWLLWPPLTPSPRCWGPQPSPLLTGLRHEAELGPDTTVRRPECPGHGHRGRRQTKTADRGQEAGGPLSHQIAQGRRLAHALYEGKLEDGTEFDSSLPQNQPFVFSLGTGQVIKGWDQGLLGMCEGEKRKLVIPSELGYGERGAPPKIPGGATLVFEVELLKIERRSEL